MMLEKILIADLQKVSGSTERKICAVGVTKILTECKFFFFYFFYILRGVPNSA